MEDSDFFNRRTSFGMGGGGSGAGAERQARTLRSHSLASEPDDHHMPFPFRLPSTGRPEVEIGAAVASAAVGACYTPAAPMARYVLGAGSACILLVFPFLVVEVMYEAHRQHTSPSSNVPALYAPSKIHLTADGSPFFASD